MEHTTENYEKVATAVLEQLSADEKDNMLLGLLMNSYETLLLTFDDDVRLLESLGVTIQ